MVAVRRPRRQGPDDGGPVAAVPDRGAVVGPADVPNEVFGWGKISPLAGGGSTWLSAGRRQRSGDGREDDRTDFETLMFVQVDLGEKRLLPSQ
ncbi:hypothetical protein Q3G72_009816 [Acer saccharum]|nr:hypothetical protein Q3G72_009816 [Acer saccharum]